MCFKYVSHAKIQTTMMSSERIPAIPHGEATDSNLRKIDAYVQDYIGITPTKYASEEQKNCPPLDLAIGIQRLMAQDHKAIYGNFSSGYTCDFGAEYALQVLALYDRDMRLVPAEYGTIPNADVRAYFDAGISRYYQLVRDEIITKSESQSVAVSFLQIADRYLANFKIEPWEAVRFTTRLVRKHLPSLMERARQIHLTRDLDKRLVTRLVFLDFLNSESIHQHFTDLKSEVDAGAKINQAFNYLLKENEPIRVAKEGGILEMFESDFEQLMTAYHLAERPFTKEELLVGQELLDTDPYLRAALIIFHYQLMNFIAMYLAKHPERLAHTTEHLTEIFLTAENAEQYVRLLPNPKLLKVISRNVMPAIARSYLQEQATELDGTHIAQGAQTAKDLLLFQTFIGEFHTSQDGSGNVFLDSFVTQTCPAMQPFSKALIEVLPPIYQNCKQKEITFEG